MLVICTFVCEIRSPPKKKRESYIKVVSNLLLKKTVVFPCKFPFLGTKINLRRLLLDGRNLLRNSTVWRYISAFQLPTYFSEILTTV